VAEVGKLSERQLLVLRWIGDGCPEGTWPDESHKHTARALASRGLAEVRRRNKVWTATVTEAGQYYLAHGRPMPRPDPPARGRAAGRLPPIERGQRQGESWPADVTAVAMRRVASRPKPARSKQSRREIEETYVRYKVVVTRVQVAERFVRATSDEDAAAKVQAEFDRPYGYFGSWKTTTSEVDVVEAEQTTVIGPVHLANDGPVLLSLKDAAKALGVSYLTIYQMANQGDIEWVLMGTRKFIARQALMDFIKANTHRGYYVAR
jgi:excisionase family DNA binding protein